MEKNKDLRRASVSAVNGLPRRRQRITTLRDPADQDRQMDLQETVRLGDREQLQKKDREREFPKRRRLDSESCRENESTESSDEEYYEEEEEARIHPQNRTNQLSSTSSSLSNNRRGLRTLRSSPVLRAAADEMFGVPIPRRARSSSAKRLHEYCNSGSGGFGEDSSHRRISPSPATVKIGSGGASPSSSGVSMKKKMKSVERRTPVFSGASNPKSSVIQDDIEIEVAEALFDLMKQSQSQSHSSQSQEKVDRDGINTGSDELKILKADGGKDENIAFSVQNEPSIKVNAETILADSVKESKRDGRIAREKFPDDPAQELVNGDGFVNKVKVGSPKESESPSCVKVNACDIEGPTVTKAHYEAIIAESKREAKLEIDLMALPSLPLSPERDAVGDVGTDPEVTIQVVQKKSGSVPKDGPLAVAKDGQLHTEKHRHDDISSVGHGAIQQHQGLKEQKNQSPSSLLPFPIGISSWPGVLPHPGYMPPLQAVLPVTGTAKSSMIMQPPQFKFSQPRPKRCATHQFLAQSIHDHLEIIKKSLSSGSAGPAALYGTRSSNLNYMLPPTQNFIPGNQLPGNFHRVQNSANVSVGSVKDKSSDAAGVFDANATTNGRSVLQQASNPASASHILHGPGFIFPLGHHQATMMAAANSSGSPQSASAVANVSLSSNSIGRLSVNSPLPPASAAVSLNHPLFPSNEAYITMLQNSGCPIPISTNIAMPPFKGGTPSVPFFNPSLYSSPVFNVAQNQQQLAIPHAPVQSAPQTMNSPSHKPPVSQQQSSGKISDNTFPTSASTMSQQPEKPLQASHLSSKSDAEISQKSGTSVAHGFVSHSVKPGNSQMCSSSAQPMNFAMIPPVSLGGGAGGNKNTDPPQQGSKGRMELVPQAFALSFGSSASTTSALNFSSMAQNSAMFHMLPDMSWNGNHMVHQKNVQASEEKSVMPGGQSFNFLKSDGKEMPALSTMGPPKFGGLARTINFLPPSLAGNQPFQTSSAALSSGVSVTIPNFQQHQHQQQLIQVQNPQMHQLQLSGIAQVKSSIPNGIPGSFLTSIFPSNSHVFTQVSIPNDNPSQSPTSSHVNIPQLWSSQGQTHSTFANSPVAAASFQGHKVLVKSEAASSLMVGSSSNSCTSRNMGISQRIVSTVGTAASTISAVPSQEAEASPGGTAQKSSPACRRNVPSILSTCPSQLPELKY